MYEALMPPQTIRPQVSNTVDKVTKVLTFVFALTVVTLSIILSIFESSLGNTLVNLNEQTGLVGYISKNVVAPPIKKYLIDQNASINFRVQCLPNEELEHLFPWNSTFTMNEWRAKLICVERYKSFNYSDTAGLCRTSYKKCGEYCIPKSEGLNCPITKVEIRAKDEVEPIQMLDETRGLYVTRDDGSTAQGIYRIEVDIDGLPCQNDAIRNLGGVAVVNSTYIDQTTCDSNGVDGANSFKIDSIPLLKFMEDNVNSTQHYQSRGYIKIFDLLKSQLTFKHNLCEPIDPNLIALIQDCASNIKELGFLYTVIRCIIGGLIMVVLIMDTSYLKCKFWLDLRLLSTILKFLTLLLMTFFLIEGALISRQVSDKQEIEDYYKTIGSLGCFVSGDINGWFKDFPNLFAGEYEDFISTLMTILLVILILGGLLLILYVVQITRWCTTSNHDGLKPRDYAELEFDKVRQEVQLAHSSDNPVSRHSQSSDSQFEMSVLEKKLKKKKKEGGFQLSDFD